MKRCTATALTALALALGATGAAEAKPGKPRQVLFFTKSSGFEHNPIKTPDGQPSLATKILEELGAKHGFQVTSTKDGSQFTAENLAKYDVLIFYTTGDLTKPGNDKHPPFPEGGKELLLETIKKGKGFIGIHAASDTFHTPPDNRFQQDGENTDPFIKMLGGEFIRHGQQQTARVFCTTDKFPGQTDCKAPFDLHEEWYSFKNLANDLHVLQWIGTWSMKNVGGDSVYRRAPYPVTWARMHGKGRVYYTALGHREDVWQSERFQNMLVGAVKWTAGDARANIKPNISQVTPFYAEMPPEDPKPPKPAAPAAAAAPAAKPAPTATPTTTAPAPRTN